MALQTPSRLVVALLAGALLLAPLGARAGFFDKFSGGGKGGGQAGGSGDGGGHGGGKGGLGSGALIGALVGGVSAVVHGGDFKDGAKAGAHAAADQGHHGDGKRAWEAGKNAAEQSKGGQHKDWNPFSGGSGGSGHDGKGHDGKGSDGKGSDGKGSDGKGSGWDGKGSGSSHSGGHGDDNDDDHEGSATTVQGQASGQAALNAAQAAALGVTVTLPPAATTGIPGEPGEEGYSEEQVQGYVDQRGKPEFAPPGKGQPAPPSPLASLDVPKRYQVNVPPVPPGVEVKGGQATADAQTASLKLNADTVASAFGTTVDLQAIKAPASLDHPDGARRLSGEVGGGRADPRDREGALRATVTAGNSRFGLKDYDGALAEAEAAIALAPANPEGYLLYAKTLNRLGLHAKAEAMARKARKLGRTLEEQALAESEVTQALLYQNRVSDALASAVEVAALGQRAGNKGLEANGLFLQAAACQLKGDRACMVKSLERAAYLDAKYYAALEAAKAGKNVFDPNDKESLGLLDAVTDDVPLPAGLGALGGGLLAVIAGLAGFAGLAWRRARREAAKAALAAAFGGKKDDGLLAGKYALGKAVALEGRGACEAWEAEDRSLGRRALAVRLPTPEAAEEARRLASVHHPNMVDVFEVVDTPKGQFLVRERLSGRTLAQLLAARGKLDFGEARRLLAPVCEALEAARGVGIVNGGLSLSSVMLCDEGFVKVTDLSAHATRGDVQALAACLAELLTGRPHRPDVPLAGAAPELSTFLMDAAAGRIPGPAAFAARLERLGESVRAG